MFQNSFGFCCSSYQKKEGRIWNPRVKKGSNYRNSWHWNHCGACKLGLRPTLHVCWPLAKPNPTACSLACRWRLQSALRADKESFLWSPARILDGMAWLYSSELSFSYCILLHHILWLVYSACKLGLRPTQHVGWPSAKPNPTVCSLACHWVFFYWIWPASGSELFYSCIAHYLHPSRVEYSSL